MLSVFIGILTVLMVVISVLLVLIVLMQRPKQEGLGAAFGGGMMDSVAGAHTSDVLQKGTTWLGTFFLGFAILLAVLKAQELKAFDPGEVLPAAQVEPAIPSAPPSISDLPSSAPAPASDAPSTPAGDEPKIEGESAKAPKPAAPPAVTTPEPAAPAPAEPAEEKKADQ